MLAARSIHPGYRAEMTREDDEDERDPLVARLRALRWPEPPDHLRDRAWQDFQKRFVASRARDAG
jgi:hypothetical protein